MKPFSFVLLLAMLLVAIILQSCGGGSDKAVNGSLTLTTPTVTGPTGGYYTVSSTLTYTPPTGKDPNGLDVKVTMGGVSKTIYLDSTGSYVLTDYVAQTTSSVVYTISASTGDLTSSVATILEGLTPLNASTSPILFASTDAAGTVKTTTIGGGVSPYAVSLDSTSSSDLVISLSGTTLSITKTSTTGTTQKSGTITVTDSAGSKITILVYYY
ncbi:hypothetical protein FO488_07280 [Geobacter sp. FeAm09]|uniref:hypothetical protein n=1 Tax=Geobacter sp. FeAm09 TaxID=2597769 RepID=UPI0011EDC89C|nr:hypothetical protein [Geobacter sp. FeAm09]QEM67978.1 hypothetical protein FO488_07280 [Geobacter sp. FeAm09]